MLVAVSPRCRVVVCSPMSRDGLTCVRLIRDYEAKGLLAPPPQTPETKSSNQPLAPITSYVGDLSERRRPRIPILAVSANARMEQIQQALAAGMDDAISKPFRIPELWPKILGLVPKTRLGGDGIREQQ
jgi:CheY-like chemotaxis protein